jgi:voltage-gated potassium channel
MGRRVDASRRELSPVPGFRPLRYPETRLATGRPRAFVLYLAVFTAIAAVVGGLLARALAPRAFGSFGESLWWALQTFTTVGYGDVIPDTGYGKVVAAVIMLTGVATISVFTAVVTAAFIESRTAQREERDDAGHAETQVVLRTIAERLDALEAKIDAA